MYFYSIWQYALRYIVFIDTFIIYPSNAIQLYKSRNILEYLTNHKAIKLKQFLDNDDNEKEKQRKNMKHENISLNIVFWIKRIIILY